MSPLDLAFLSLIRRKSSSLLAVIALGSALGLSGFLLTLQSTLSKSLANHEPGIDAFIGPKSSSLRLLINGLFFTGNESEIIDYRLNKTINEEVSPERLIPFALYAHYRGIPIIGTEDSFYDFIKRDYPDSKTGVSQGRWFNLQTENPEAVLGAQAARILDLKLDDWILPSTTLKGREGVPIWSKKTRVVGILRESGFPHDRAVYTPISEAFESHLKGHEEGVLSPD